MEKYYPELFKRIKDRVKEGRWEPVAPWVEFDANMASGESIVRHLVYSKRYFKECFDLDINVLWLPDTFGFPVTIPQLMKGAKINYLLIHKLNLNDMTIFPYNYFWWESPDGSRVLTHQTLGGYGGRIYILERMYLIPHGRRIYSLRRMLQEAKLKHGIEAVLIMIGYGDHGGGLSEDMVKNALEIINKGELNARFVTATEFFKWLEEVDQRVKLPTWRDELYLQFHRGTFTTQSKQKRLNRMAEQILLNAERIASIASWYGYKYPLQTLKELWITLLFNQFHDILAGCSIPDVHKNSERDLKKVIKEAKRIIEEAINHIVSLASVRKGDFVVFNTLPWSRTTVVEANGKLLPLKLPALGYSVIKGDEEVRGTVRLKEEGENIVMENEYLRAVISTKTGTLIGLYIDDDNVIDKERNGVHVQIFKDEPTLCRVTLKESFDISFDAWELYIFQQPEGVVKEDLIKPEKVEILDKGSHRARVHVVYVFKQSGRKDSKFEITYELYSGMPWITLKFKVEWFAKHRCAKLFIPLSYYAEYAIYDQPYGWIKRRNPLSPDATLHERAKWEVPGQMWVDIPGNGKGLAVFDDGKYGYDFGGSFIRVSLLRSATYPNPRGKPWEGEPPITDQGIHEFKIGLMPYKAISILDITKFAYEFNNEPILVRVENDGKGYLPDAFSFLKIENAIGTVLKLADDGDGYITRFYEVDGAEKDVEIVFSRRIKDAYVVNLLEEFIKRINIKKEGNRIIMRVKPYKIISLKVRLCNDDSLHRSVKAY